MFFEKFFVDTRTNILKCSSYQFSFLNIVDKLWLQISGSVNLQTSQKTGYA